MSSPNRCIQHRYHSDPMTCPRCEGIHERRQEFRKNDTPYPEFDEELPTLPGRRRGRGSRKITAISEHEDRGDSLSPLRHRSKNIFGGLISPRATQIQEPGREDEIEPEPEILVPATPPSHIHSDPDNTMTSAPGSSTSTQVISETPLSQLLGAHNPDFRREDSPTASEIVKHGATTEAVKRQIRALRAHRNRLAENLEESTTARNSLRERRYQAEGELRQTRAVLKHTEAERDVALARSERIPVTNRSLAAMLVLLLCAVVAYVYWCWYWGPEMEYVRRRRAAVLRE